MSQPLEGLPGGPTSLFTCPKEPTGTPGVPRDEVPRRLMWGSRFRSEGKRKHERLSILTKSVKIHQLFFISLLTLTKVTISCD